MLPVVALALALAVGGTAPDTRAASQSTAEQPAQQRADLPFNVADGPLPEFDEPVDVVINEDQLDEYLAEVEANPGPYEGWVVGVVPNDVVSQERQAVIDGGDAAAAVDQESLSAARAVLPQQTTPPLCPEDNPAADGVGVYLACNGHEPRAVFRARPELGLLEPEHVLESAIQELSLPPPATETAAGLYSILAGLDEPVRSVAIEGSTAIVDLRAEVASLGLNSAFVRTVFVHQVVATATQFDGVDAVQFRLEGSCEEFAAATEGDGCAAYRLEDLEASK